MERKAVFVATSLISALSVLIVVSLFICDGNESSIAFRPSSLKGRRRTITSTTTKASAKASSVGRSYAASFSSARHGKKYIAVVAVTLVCLAVALIVVCALLIPKSQFTDLEKDIQSKNSSQCSQSQAQGQPQDGRLTSLMAVCISITVAVTIAGMALLVYWKVWLKRSLSYKPPTNSKDTSETHGGSEMGKMSTEEDSHGDTNNQEPPEVAKIEANDLLQQSSQQIVRLTEQLSCLQTDNQELKRQNKQLQAERLDSTRTMITLHNMIVFPELLRAVFLPNNRPPPIDSGISVCPKAVKIITPDGQLVSEIAVPERFSLADFNAVHAFVKRFSGGPGLSIASDAVFYLPHGCAVSDAVKYSLRPCPVELTPVKLESLDDDEEVLQAMRFLRQVRLAQLHMQLVTVPPPEPEKFESQEKEAQAWSKVCDPRSFTGEEMGPQFFFSVIDPEDRASWIRIENYWYD